MKQSERIERLEDLAGAMSKDLVDIKQILLERVLPEPQEKKAGRWKPENGDKFNFVCAYGLLKHEYWIGSDCNKYLYSQGNCFQTEQEAEDHLAYLEALGRVRLYIEENHWFEHNTSSRNERTFAIVHDGLDGEIMYISNRYLHASKIPLLDSIEAAEDVISNNIEDLAVIFNLNKDE